VKEISKKFADSSTVYGLNRVIKADSPLMKIVWALMALVSLAFGLYLTSETIKGYLEYEVLTQTKSVASSSSILPSVTFCFSTNETKDLNAFFNKSEFFTDVLTTNFAGEQFYDDYFGGYNIRDCIMFNHYTNKSDNKLFTAKSLDDQFFFRIDLNRKFSKIFVLVSDNYDYILDWSKFVSINHNTRGKYEISFKKELEFKLEEPYNLCQNVSDITYRQTNCLAQCRNKNIVRKYNCTLGNYYSIPGYSYCKNRTSYSSEFDSDCEKECPKECTVTKFDILVNNPLLNENFSDLLGFFVYYSDLNYVEIRQSPKMSGYSLMNEIGGALSLFVGISFLSLLELLEYLFEIILVFYNYSIIN